MNTIRTFAAAVLSLLIVIGVGVVAVPAQAPSPHAYFEALTARADHWKSYSLRSPAQLASRRNGGYANSNSDPLDVTYDPAHDQDPQAQDAAKVVIPPFGRTTQVMLASDIDAQTLVVPMSNLSGDVTKVSTGLNAKGDQLKIDDEIVITSKTETPLNRATGLVKLSQRGAYGTVAKAHTAKARVYTSVNSLGNQVRVPFNSHDGATWMITWDAYFTQSFMDNGIGNYKAFQLSSKDSIWLEPQVEFSGGKPRPASYDRAKHIGVAGRVRSYNKLGGPAIWSPDTADSLGPIVTHNSAIEPALPFDGGAFFLVHPGRWTRWWIRIEQRANDYDYMDLWMADEFTEPIQVYSRIPLSVRPTKGVYTINQFWVEFNTSTAQLPAGRTKDFRNLVAYVRNIAILKNPQDMSSLLVKPVAGPAR